MVSSTTGRTKSEKRQAMRVWKDVDDVFRRPPFCVYPHCCEENRLGKFIPVGAVVRLIRYSSLSGATLLA